MANNPSYSQVTTGQQAGNAPTNALNDPKTGMYQGGHRFGELSYCHAFTARYGEGTPFFVMDGIGGDQISLSNNHTIRTLSMQSPMMSQLRMHKGYYQVPYSAILPRNWEKIFANPTHGDDVPDDAYCYNESFLNSLKNQLDRWLQYFSFSSVGEAAEGDIINTIPYTRLFKLLEIIKNTFSDGGLFAMMGNKIPRLWNTASGYDSFDSWYDANIHLLLRGLLFRFTYDPDTQISYRSQLIIPISENNPDLNSILHQYHSLYNVSATVTFGGFLNLDDDTYDPRFADRDAALQTLLTGLSNVPESYGIDWSRIIAYQMAMIQYFTNDKIDYVFDVPRWRDYMETLISIPESGVSQIASFVYNDINVLYDTFSGANLELFSTLDMLISVTSSDIPDNILSFFVELTGFKNSLRYGDYFTGARPQPLAVGDVTAPVVGDGVSAIDMTKNIQMQRFLNWCNNVGQNMRDYFKGMRGVEPPVRQDIPKYIALQDFGVNVDETTNTAQDQGNVTSLVRSSNGSHSFDITLDCDCVIIGILYFDALRLYSGIVERQWLHKDRFDKFNKFLQYTGDQPVYKRELNANGSLDAYAYQGAYMEYKQRVSQASGGFINYLPSYTFITDNGVAGQFAAQDTINPEYIRSVPVEFDRYFPSLTGYSPASYFHFLLFMVNSVDARRQMDVNPRILA